MASNKKVLILSGPGGSGKTTIADLLVEKYDFIKIDGDDLDTEFFPDGKQWLPENSDKLEQAHNKILSEVKKIFNKSGKNVVLDYIIFNNYLEFFKKFKAAFENNLEIKILLPTKEEIIKRDEERKCWTTGVERISSVHAEFENIKNVIGPNNFIDTTGETVKTTFEKYFN